MTNQIGFDFINYSPEQRVRELCRPVMRQGARVSVWMQALNDRLRKVEVAVLADTGLIGLLMFMVFACARAPEVPGVVRDFAQVLPGATPIATETPSISAPASDGIPVLLGDPDPARPRYDRDDWRHWTDDGGDCLNVRHEVLIAESLVPVTFNDSGCYVASGRWYGAYTGETTDNPRDLDVDHMVPLAAAHHSGGWRWSPEEKERYANDETYPGHLIAVFSGVNRSKGADGPDEWRPPNRDHWCSYATDWTTVKSTWGLTVTEPEFAALHDMLTGCDPGIELRRTE